MTTHRRLLLVAWVACIAFIVTLYTVDGLSPLYPWVHIVLGVATLTPARR